MSDYKYPTPSLELARFVCSLRYDSLPVQVVDKIKSILLDGIACGCYGRTKPWGKMVYEFVQELGGKEEATLWLTDFKGPAVNVALALGTAIHAFDYDDYHKSKLHPASVIIPAALTMAEREGGVTTRQFLVALVAGYEVMIRVGLSVNPGVSRLKGWHLTGTCGVFGSAAAAGKILGLDEEQMAWALGIAGTQASGLWAFNYDGAMTKRLHPGRASQSGIMAAILAKKGFTGPIRILDAEDGGFWRATSDKPVPEKLLQAIGKKFECADTCIKPYASCGSNHAAIDAVRAIMANQHVAVTDIEKIIVFTSRVIKTQTGFDYLPATVLQAQMSLKYAVSAAIMFGNVLPEHMEEKCFGHPDMRRLMEKVEIVVDPEMDSLYPEHFCSKVLMITKDGKRYQVRINDPLGSEERPLKWDDVVNKASNLLRGIMAESHFNKLVEGIKNLARAEDEDIGAICKLLKI
ncbi:MmgE/PrpD family protein [Neomoorella mulderi]|uniref:2-methylcitrate dehydratase n=1 Tax=Moorella mulderi DSM 14980 TaxID=1122241 RepID=A0A151AXC4_9FIRM|nr:MmgE/PrpD family protein [Moorella mulderi]KYH32210.1 2-methylcitrate dehydratase [Moorella mulderi DSM 14980]